MSVKERFAPVWVTVMFVVIIPALAIIPYTGSPSGDAVSQATAAGFSNRLAYLVAVVWIAVTLTGAWWLAGLAPVLRQTGAPASDPPAAKGLTGLVLPLLVFLVIAVLFYPPAQALTGPRLEESIHLNAIHRMRSGDLPYRDFEFLYGPLMLYPAYWWTGVFGWSLASYYGYIAVLELLVMLALTVPIRQYFNTIMGQIAAYLLMAGFYFNALLGPNQNGLRKLAGVLVLLWLAKAPMARHRWVGAGICIGLLLAYSQEFGAATAIGVAAIYIAIAAKTRSLPPLLVLVGTGAVSAMTWIAILWLLLGPSIGDYFTSVAWLTRRFDLGEAAFSWYWTVSGLSVFGLIALGCLQAGRVLAQRWTRPAGPSDLFFIAAVAYAALLLKSGLNRADQWHLVPVVLPIAFGVLLPLGATTAPLTRLGRTLGLGLIFVLAMAYSFGQFPIARYVFRERLVEGYQLLLSGATHSETIPGTHDRPMMLDTGAPKADLLDVARFFATPEMRERAVFIYGRNWSLPYQTGARRVGYLTDDYIYGDERGAQARALLDADHSILVVIRPEEWDWITGLAGDETPMLPFNLGGWGVWRTVRAYVSSVHIPAVPVEEDLKTLRWRRLLGDWVAVHYEPVYRSDRYVVLGRKAEQ